MCFSLLFLSELTTGCKDRTLLVGSMPDRYGAFGCIVLLSVNPVPADGKWMSPAKSSGMLVEASSILVLCRSI